MRISVAWILFAVVGLGAGPAMALDAAGGPNCCAHCGRHACCAEKTCKVVCDVKKETKTSWSVECQDICTLLPGHHDRCDECQPPPRCGRQKTVKKLVKHEYQVEVPIYKCVVVHLCPACANGQTSSAPAAPLPAASPSVPPMPLPPLAPTQPPR